MSDIGVEILEGKENPYEHASTLIDQVKAQSPHLSKLVAWFPSAEDYLAMQRASDEEKADSIVETLGNEVRWHDAVDFLHMYRPQDGYTAVGGLGMSREEAFEVLPLVSSTSLGLTNYSEHLINDLLKGNMVILASRLKTVGQAVGFHQKLLSKLGEMEDINITFDDGSSPIKDSVASVIYIADEAPRDMLVKAANYDPQIRKFNLQLPQKV